MTKVEPVRCAHCGNLTHSDKRLRDPARLRKAAEEIDRVWVDHPTADSREGILAILERHITGDTR